MNRILKIGMDVHSTNYTICVVEPKLEGDPELLYETQVLPDYKNIVDIIDKLKKRYKEDELHICCGYEAGCLGYTLFHELEKVGVNCVILAPSTMEMPGGKRIKTDGRDAWTIARCLSTGGYSAVHIPTQKDEDIRDYLRMRDDTKELQKSLKQRINAFCLRHGFKYGKSRWTGVHIKWLKGLPLDGVQKETLEEYILTYEQLEERIQRYDRRIKEFAAMEEYRAKVEKLRCFIGIKTYSALSLIVETGDFARFEKGNIYSSYLGLVPGEHSSSDSIHRLSITKAGNKHARMVLVEAAQAYSRGKVGGKSKALRERQKGRAPEIIAYADRANERLRRKFQRLSRKGKERNKAVVAIARELACFVWGMMTGHMDAA